MCRRFTSSRLTSQVCDGPCRFLRCVGLPSSDTGKEHMERLKAITEATLDLYTFLRSSSSRVPFHLQEMLEFSPLGSVEPFQDEDLVHMWLSVKIRPLLHSITKHLLICMSTKNFSCTTYQAVVREFSLHFSDLNPARQKWIYSFFMYPFLSGEGIAGCVRPEESSEEWLMKNFGFFKASARMKDFSQLNMVFNGLEVLHLLSPEQKAELLLRPEVAGLDNGTLSLVFNSLMAGGPTIRPVGNLVSDFIMLTREQNVSEIRSSTLIQLVVNRTLAEMASKFKPQMQYLPTLAETFDLTDVEVWYSQVVMPILQSFLTPGHASIGEDIRQAFHTIFYLDSVMSPVMDNDTSELQDTCSISLQTSCGLTNAVEDVAQVLHCVSRSHLTLSADTVMTLVAELTQRLGSLVQELSTVDFEEVVDYFRELFHQVDSPAPAQENLDDPDFVRLWFRIKLLPLLPDVPTYLLTCLSMKNFTCPAYQALVAELSEQAPHLDPHHGYGPMVYRYLILPFLLHHNTTDPQCVSSANNSAEWLEDNFGSFSMFAVLPELYQLNPHFAALETLHLLTPTQTAKLLLLSLPSLEGKELIVNTVFDYLIESPKERNFRFVVYLTALLAKEVNPPCPVFRLIVEHCLPLNVTCPITLFNVTRICIGVNSTGLETYLNTSDSMAVPCQVPLEEYACAMLESLTANQLVSLLKCELPGDTSHSRRVWKMLLTKLSPLLEPALDRLANMTTVMVGPSAPEILDVIGELKVVSLSDQQLRDPDLMRLWFSRRLKVFLASASGSFLRCLGNRNLSCQSYQQILEAFSSRFEDMSLEQQQAVLTELILPFLSRPGPDSSCVLGFNSSEWLQKHLGPFSALLSLEDILQLNPAFSALEALRLLTPMQMAEILLLPALSREPHGEVIKAVFNYVTSAPLERRFQEVLYHLAMLSGELPPLAPEVLAVLLMCNRSRTSPAPVAAWKLLFSKTTAVLDHALDLLSNMTFNPRYPAISLILDAIADVRLHTFPPERYESEAFIHLWFGQRLRPFLPAISSDTLSCLSTKNLSCSTYQSLIQIFSRHQPSMEHQTQVSVYMSFIRSFLTKNSTADPNCSNGTTSRQWLQENFGGFSTLVSVSKLLVLNSDFLPLTSPDQVAMLLDHVPSPQLADFFDDFSPTIMVRESALLQEVFDRANLSDPAVSDAEVLLWLDIRLRPLLVELSPFHVAPFFGLVAGRNCSTEQDGVRILNSTRTTLNTSTQNGIHHHIIQLLREPTPLRCYGNNYNQSFYGFLNGWFLDFQYPNLTTFLSLMPESQQLLLVNSLPPSHLGDLLRRLGTMDEDANLCLLYSLYTDTPVFLETETLPEMVRQQTLPCVWPTALSSTERLEVNAWFDRRLPSYFGFLTKDLLTSTATRNASCLAFQRLVSALASHDYNATDFNAQDVYDVIKAYLTSETVPKCYNADDPDLNSTAWFAEYIGAFMPFLTLNDLNMFGSAQVIQVFTVNPLNIDLLDHAVLPVNLTTFFIELIYLQDSNFNPMLLPPQSQCSAPGAAFDQLSADQTEIILQSLKTICTDLEPEIFAILAANFGDDLSADNISALGSEGVSGISACQLNNISPQDLLDSLGVLSNAQGWNQGQAMAIIQSLVSSGMFKSPAFLGHLTNAPTIVQQTVVTKIISVNNSSSTAIIENVPDNLATEIPRVFLIFHNTTVVTKLNRRKWKQEQAVLFFDTVAEGFINEEKKISRLVKACRRRGRQRVILKETQLTCMYNQIEDQMDINDFTMFPPDVLLYYNYSRVPPENCSSYFEELADADFSVFSDTLNFKRTALFNHAKSCLNIMGSGLNRDNVMVLGNMCCTLDGSYIQNSDPFILEKLKNCPDFTEGQVAAMEKLLLNGTSTYGAPATWNRQTLEDLEILPLYMTEAFYREFDKRTKRRFLKSFLRTFRRNGVSRRKKRRMKRAIRDSIRNSSGRRKRAAADDECTVGEITQAIIVDTSFPFDYSSEAQFNSCLSVVTTRDNLASITQAVDDQGYLRIVLNKLREAYASESSIPEGQVQVLGPASRTATSEDISMWNITQVDTLSALMASANGDWEPDLAAAIISKYLRSDPENSLGSLELNSIGGANLCALDVSQLKNISPESIRTANAPTLTNCTIEKKRALFIIAAKTFTSTARDTTISITNYQLIMGYTGGADQEYVSRLAMSNVSMDLEVFTGLDPEVVE
ncbi:hypothetical protein NHX12_018858, partial [Muraenolepis orangiensis]